jgi:CheY-like chemotaxis protein
MVVDDEPDWVYIVKNILQREGLEVLTAQSGEECLERLRDERPDLILMDVMMPGMDGWETCRELKKLTPSTPVLILSIRRDPEDIERSLKYAHADAHLCKPIDIKKLISEVKSYLSNGRNYLKNCQLPRDYF